MKPLKNAVLTEHVINRCEVRNISLDLVIDALAEAMDVVLLRPGRVAVNHLVQGRLLRIIVDTDRDPPEVVTAYITSNIRRYWRN